LVELRDQLIEFNPWAPDVNEGEGDEDPF
jgi:hypothetical protein